MRVWFSSIYVVTKSDVLKVGILMSGEMDQPRSASQGVSFLILRLWTKYAGEHGTSLAATLPHVSPRLVLFVLNETASCMRCFKQTCHKTQSLAR